MPPKLSSKSLPDCTALSSSATREAEEHLVEHELVTNEDFDAKYRRAANMYIYIFPMRIRKRVGAFVLVPPLGLDTSIGLSRDSIITMDSGSQANETKLPVTNSDGKRHAKTSWREINLS